MHARRREADQLELFDLIVHQADERRNNQAALAPGDRRELIAERFAAPRGHHAQQVAAAQERVDELFLTRLKGVVAKD